MRVVKVTVTKVDRQTLRSVRYPLFVPEGSEQEMLKALMKGLNVGDFVALPNGKVFRRLRGGFREATAEDLSELIGSQLASEGEELSHIIYPYPYSVRCECVLKHDVEVSVEELWRPMGVPTSPPVRRNIRSWVYQRGTAWKCEENLFPLNPNEIEKSIAEKFEKVANRLFEACIQKEDFKPFIVHSPREPMHYHADFLYHHPVMRKHRKLH